MPQADAPACSELVTGQHVIHEHLVFDIRKYALRAVKIEGRLMIFKTMRAGQGFRNHWYSVWLEPIVDQRPKPDF